MNWHERAGRRSLGAARQAGIDECSRGKRGTLAYAVTPRDHGGANIILRPSNGSPGRQGACRGSAAGRLGMRVNDPTIKVKTQSDRGRSQKAKAPAFRGAEASGRRGPGSRQSPTTKTKT